MKQNEKMKALSLIKVGTETKVKLSMGHQYSEQLNKVVKLRKKEIQMVRMIMMVKIRIQISQFSLKHIICKFNKFSIIYLFY